MAPETPIWRIATNRQRREVGQSATCQRGPPPACQNGTIPHSGRLKSCPTLSCQLENLSHIVSVKARDTSFARRPGFCMSQLI